MKRMLVLDFFFNRCANPRRDLFCHAQKFTKLISENQFISVFSGKVWLLPGAKGQRPGAKICIIKGWSNAVCNLIETRKKSGQNPLHHRGLRASERECGHGL